MKVAVFVVAELVTFELSHSGVFSGFVGTVVALAALVTALEVLRRKVIKPAVTFYHRASEGIEILFSLRDWVNGFERRLQALENLLHPHKKP